MALFEYKGVDSKGKAVRGVVDGDSGKTARLRLKQKGIFPTDIKEKTSAASSSKGSSRANLKDPAEAGKSGIKLKSLTIMIRQLSTLIKARIPLDDSLAAAIEQTEDQKLKTILSQLKVSVNEGKSLTEACRAFPKVFSPIFLAMIRVGEASGNLDLVLNRLAEFSEAQYELRNKVMGAMAYPLFMMVAGIGITIFLFAFAVPKITEVFEGSNMPLPPITVLMIGISHFMANHWLIMLLSIPTFAWIARWYVRTPKGREKWDTISLKLPGFGKLRRMIAISRFARTLSTLIGSGVQLLDAIDIVKDVVDNMVIRKALIQSRDSISEGKSISSPLRASGEFPPVLIHMIAVGEKTGELEDMLNVVSDSYDEQVDTAISALTRLLEPLMIVVMGGVIALVAISIFLPMLQLNNLAQAPG